MDQVDYAFCATVRSRGWRILECTDVLMDHQIGKSVEVAGMMRRYETGQRLYYIVRNSTFLVLRRQLPASVYLAQLVSWGWAYVVVNGLSAVPREMAILVAGLSDGILRRLGQRQYSVSSRNQERAEQNPNDERETFVDHAKCLSDTDRTLSNSELAGLRLSFGPPERKE